MIRTHSSVCARALSVLMILMMFFCMASVSFAAPGGGTASGTSDAAGNSPFDMVQVNDDGTISMGGGDDSTNFGGVVKSYKSVATIIFSILTVTMLVLLGIQITKLGAAGDNEIARKKATMGILTTGIATALLGGSTIVVSFFWNALVNAVK